MEKESTVKMDQTTSPKIEIWDRITREDVRQNKDKIFLFGDNLIERGIGGQAKEMRGEENSRGIPTKKAPNNNRESFFTDKEFAANSKAIDEAFGKIPLDKTVVIPKAGIGTGLAQLSENAPQTFAYLNKKFAEIGFDNQTGRKIVSASKDEKKVVVGNNSEKPIEVKRLLDLNNIQTANLRLLSPTEKEVDALNIDRQNALTDYASRLRADYKANKENLRDGFKLLSDSVDKGEQITVSCSCRGGEMCHADVVKMAIEKVNLFVNERQIREADRIPKNENQNSFKNEKTINSQKPENKINPRTQRAINEILSFSENDRLIEKIGETDGRNRSEQASHLGKQSQFVRDIYERGGKLAEGNLIVPQEKLSVSPPLAVTTQDYAVRKIGKILRDESKAKEIAPVIVEYGNKIAGTTADGETKLKVFGWIYESLEGKNDFLEREDNNGQSQSKTFDNSLEQIRIMAEEMHSLEPMDKLEFVPMSEFEQSGKSGSFFENAHENLNLEEIYETAISFDESEKAESVLNEHLASEQINDLEIEKISTERFERIELSGNIPQIPEEFTEQEISRLLSETLPDIDRQLENGISQKEILKPYNEIVWQSAKDDALNRLEKIYQKQKIAELDAKLGNNSLTAEQKKNLESEKSLWKAAVFTPTQEDMREILLNSREKPNDRQLKTQESQSAKTISQLAGFSGELSESIKEQIDKIDLHRQNVIELKSPSEYKQTEAAAVSNFFRRSKQETLNLLEKSGESQDKSSDDKTAETVLKKELNQIKNAKPSFAFKLENSSEIIVGEPSVRAIEERAFISSYVNFQLKQPDVRLRHENDRYRQYAAKLETAVSRDDVKKISSEVRNENAAIGFKWKDLEKEKQEKLARPLTSKEIQFLFTEVSPPHYTNEMTAVRLSYAHAGASRRAAVESLVKGEIRASPEANRLIKSLESRLGRREIKDAVSATKHFFESLKSPNDSLKYKNDFDHREIYKNLPPPEKDFVYSRATQQKENLEYKIAYNQYRLMKAGEISRDDKPKTETSKTEKSFHLLSSFHQARILGEKIESDSLVQKEVSQRDVSAALVLLKNQTTEKVELISQQLQNQPSLENKKIGEVLETFGKAEISKEENKTVVSIKLPENSLLETETYRELLEKFYPDNERENDKYKFAKFGEKSLQSAREKGQDEAVKNSQEDIQNNVYQGNVSANIFLTEQKVVERYDKIKQFQEEARNARRENEGILEKYSRRATAKLQKDSIPSPNQQKETVSYALGTNAATNNSNKQFFQVVQKEITISDFQNFAANEKTLGEIKTHIKNEFTEILRESNVLEQSKFKSSDIRDKGENLHQSYQNLSLAEENRLLTDQARQSFANGASFEGKTLIDLIENNKMEKIRIDSLNHARVALEPELKTTEEKDYNEQTLKMADELEKAHELTKQNAPAVEISQAFESAEREKTVLGELRGFRQPENKPLSLVLYEKEMGKAEKQLWAKSLSDKLFENKDFLDAEKSLNLENMFSPQEHQQLKSEAAQIAKERLEPKEMSADHRKVSVDGSRQALATFKQFEQATDIFQTSGDKSKIHESFSKLDLEAAKLNQIREDLSRTEKLALLRDGIKSDIADLLRKNPDVKGNDFAQQTSKIITENLVKTGAISTTGDNKQIITLSREISEKLEAKGKLPDKDKTNLDYSLSKNKSDQGQQNFQAIRESLPRDCIKTKEAPIFTR